MLFHYILSQSGFSLVVHNGKNQVVQHRLRMFARGLLPFPRYFHYIFVVVVIVVVPILVNDAYIYRLYIVGDIGQY